MDKEKMFIQVGLIKRFVNRNLEKMIIYKKERWIGLGVLFALFLIRML